ncbi:restriction endonuclease subunit S [Pirellulaceae bacterium SH501]
MRLPCIIPQGFKCCLGRRMGLLRPNTRIVPEFLLWYFLSPPFQSVVYERTFHGSTVDRIPLLDLPKFPIAIPSIAEQNAIASLLTKLNDKIDLLHRQNKTLEAMAETLFRQWFVEEAINDWEVTLGDVLETCSGGTPSRDRIDYYAGGEINWVKSKELNGGFIIDTEEYINEVGLKSSAAKMLPANSILIALYGATVGEFAILSRPMTCNQAVCAIQPSEDYPFSFLFMYFKHMKEELINMAVGSAQQNISQVLVRQLKLPSNTIQTRRFHASTVDFFEKMKANLVQIRTLDKIRNTLLPKLMSGDVRVAYE